jgi:hypothetical protein
LYQITPSTPRRGVRLSGYFSTYTTDTTRVGHGAAPTVNGVPVPADAVESSGTDGTILGSCHGDEWAFWRWHEIDGQTRAENGYRYNTN